VHLNDDLDADDLAYFELPTDEEAVESAIEKRALMASFEMHQRDESGRRLMAADRRAAAAIDWRCCNRGRATWLTAATWRRRGRRG
jgi:hypothetical protein